MIDRAKLKELREAKGLSQGKLSLAAGLTRNTVSRLEAGTRGTAIQASTVAAIAKVLAVKADALLSREPPPKRARREPEDPTQRPDYDWRYG